MVKAFLFLLLFCMWRELEGAPLVEASIEMNSQAHFPLQGTITITHDKEETIDSQSFMMEGKPLETSFVKDVEISSGTLISIYHFQLPAKEKGLYVLPSVSVKIGGQIYSSLSSSYEVEEETAPPSPSSSGPIIFRLEAAVKGPSTLYPGERTKLFYRISYNRSVDLTRSELPMIHPAHFKKVGDVQIRDTQLQNITVQDLVQEVEASEIGTFSFGPSIIEGYAYNMERGQKVYESNLLKAEAPIITLEVKPLPKPAQPFSFTGGLGKIKVEAHLTSSPSVWVGDILSLQVKVEGISNLTEFHLPLLQCQPGWSGFFQMSDLPPLSEVKDQSKFFYLQFRPLTAFIHQIPAIEVSSFDPQTTQYVTALTSPISVTVHSRSLETASISTPSLIAFPAIGKWPTPFLPSLEIEKQESSKIERGGDGLKGKHLFWMILMGVSLLFLQYQGHKWWLQRPRPQIPKSEELFKEGLKTGNLYILEQAFWHRLWETGKIPRKRIQLDQLSSDGHLASLYSFLYKLQALQYSPHKSFDAIELQETAKKLFKTIL